MNWFIQLNIPRKVITLDFGYSKVRDIITRLMTEKKINAVFNTEIVGMDNSPEDAHDGLIYLEAGDGRRLPFHEVIWCTQVLSISEYDHIHVLFTRLL